MRNASDSSTPPIVFDHVWKKFRRGEYDDSLRDVIPALAKRVLRRAQPAADELNEASGDFWAVRDVSFAVCPGEVLGIIGPNGAGKSTILKLLTKILKPTRGKSEVRGRVGALIEVAAGFHGDLTGRENAFLQGAIMGMKRSEIARKMDDIIEFAGLADFMDTQVKRYSSGMQARLGFAIAAHLDPDVLIIDEVLSVGDMAFQERCMERMKQFKARGVAMVFVSHNLQQVSTLCERAIFVQNAVSAQGPVQDVVAAYLGSATTRHANVTGFPIDVLEAQLTDTNGAPVTTIAPGTPLRLGVDYAVREATTDFHFGFVLYRSTDNSIVYDGGVQASEVGLATVSAGDRIHLEFEFRPHLARGQYHVECHVFHNPSQSYLGRLAPAGVFGIAETRTYQGIVDIELSCTSDAASDAESRRVVPASGW